ncbi:MAG: SpoIIE family protein phosphatase [Peptococcaceae bacterium]|nr:SpoIIE family protein phosphatase [Peptococcaceae bacterium]
MTDWATFKAEKINNRFSGSLGSYIVVAVFGCLIARANILEIYPFALAYIAVLAMNKEQKLLPGLLGVIIGIATVQNYLLFLEVMVGALLCILCMPLIKGRSTEKLLLPLWAAICSVLPLLLVRFLSAGLTGQEIIFLIVQGALTAGFTVIFAYALAHKENIMKGSLGGEQALVWIVLLAVSLSGLHNIEIGSVNLQIVTLSFFILFIVDRFGAGAGAGSGAILGFLLQWDFSIANLVNAGIYGLVGFACGGFRRFGKLGLAISFASITMIITFFVNEGFLWSHLYSSGLGLLLFILFPGKKKNKIQLKSRVMPEVETTVSKVKTLAEIFDQLAYGFQAAGLEQKLKPEIPELMNILVERVCKNCPTANYCWEREFYRTYNFIFDLLAYQEEIMSSPDDDVHEVPEEWRRYCGRLKEMMLAAGFIVEQQKDREVWQKRLALNRYAVAEQYRNVSQVIGHLAKELHSRHNAEEGKPLVWSRQHRLLLDIGVGTFIKSGNGISGDNYSSVPLSSSQCAFILCDGMGVGEDAARMSSAALTILEQLLSTGFEPEGAVKALNSILVLRSPEESFVTIDMAVLDIETESARLIKIGAAPTYIVGQDKVEVIETSSLPAGILNDIEIPVIDADIKEKTLVLITDGVLDVVNKKNDWLKEYLSKTTNLPAQNLADRIIREVNLSSGRDFEDDGVVLVIRKKYK